VVNVAAALEGSHHPSSVSAPSGGVNANREGAYLIPKMNYKCVSQR
jgi:hypothetical protein